MKKQFLLLLITVYSLSTLGQEGHKVNAGIDLSFGLHYSNNKDGINNPFAAGGGLGYEYDFNTFFGVEIGFRGGGFNQTIGDEKGPNIGKEIKSLKAAIGEGGQAQSVYKGSYYAPYIAPKFYIPIKYDDKKGRDHFVFLENRFSYTRASLDLDMVDNTSKGAHKSFFQYEIRGGYQFPIDESWALCGWIGYNTFDFSKVKPEAIQFKNSTPFQFGVGFNYIIKSLYK